jgi:hypothetical protein
MAGDKKILTFTYEGGEYALFAIEEPFLEKNIQQVQVPVDQEQDEDGFPLGDDEDEDWVVG